MVEDKEDYTRKVYVPMSFLALDDTPIMFEGAVDKSLVVNDSETGLGYSGAKIDDHSARHEAGGDDEISLEGLSTFSIVRVFLSGIQTVANDTKTVLKLNNKEYDVNNEWDTSNYKFTAGRAGYYLCRAQVNFDDQDRIGILLIIRKNIADMGVNACMHDNETKATVSVSDIIYLDAGDEITFVVRNRNNTDSGAVEYDYEYTETFAYIARLR